MYKRIFNKILLIDLDGVLNNYNGDYDEKLIPQIKSGARDFIEKLSNDYEIKIFTTRNHILAVKWLIDNDLEKFVLDVTSIKSPAYLHIDDRCIYFNGDYDGCLQEIVNFKAYWK